MFGTYSRPGLPVSGSRRAVIRAARRRIDPMFLWDRSWREGRHAFSRQMLEYHQRAQQIVREYQL